MNLMQHHGSEVARAFVDCSGRAELMLIEGDPLAPRVPRHFDLENPREPTGTIGSASEGLVPASRRMMEATFAEATLPLMGHLVSVAKRILGDEETARDAVQEALLALWLEPEPPSNLRAWMSRAVVHRSLHLARCRSRRRRHESHAGIEQREGKSIDDPARHIEGEELARILSRAIDALSPEQRTVLVMSVIEQRDYEDIAAALNIPIGTVRSRLNRSRKALREVVERILPEGYHGIV